MAWKLGKEKKRDLTDFLENNVWVFFLTEEYTFFNAETLFSEINNI